MITNIRRSGKFALLLADEDVRSLWTTLESQYSTVAYYMNCNDGSKLMGSDVEEITGFSNRSLRKIVSIILDAENSPLSKCTLDLNKGWNTSWDIEVKDTDDAKALKVAQDINRTLLEARPWYSILTRFPAGATVAILIMIPFIVSLWSAYLKTGRITTTDQSLLLLTIMIAPICVVYVLALHYFDVGWRWMFPKLFFAIGRQKDGLKTKAFVRNLVFITVLLTLLLSLISDAFSGIFAKAF